MELNIGGKKFNPAEVVPHSKDMLFLDEILEYDDTSIKTRVIIRRDMLFYLEGKGVPAWVGLEFLAQSIAAISGIHAQLKNEPVKLGLLVGSRKTVCHVPFFQYDQSLLIKTALQWDGGELAVFEGEILDEQTEAQLLESAINVFQPDNFKAYLDEKYSL